MSAVTFVHTDGRAVTVGESTRLARLLAADKQWTKEKPKASSEGSQKRGSSRDQGAR